MTATCSTCRHWDRSRPDTVFDDEGNETELPYGRCASAESSGGKPKRGAVPVHPAYAMDVSGYHASLRTLPTFGCTLHEPVTAPSPAPTDPGAALHARVKATLACWSDEERAAALGILAPRPRVSTDEEKRANTAALVRPTMESLSRR